ncbi:MAG: transcriptional regulator [Cyclobacteriaceae bacterium]|nr:transcriptional regulator [Cyclobacteriaceae bacterium]
MKTSVLTGDLINSRSIPGKEWMPLFKEALNRYGSEPAQWEIFRGDSFQLELSPEKAVMAVLHIKATIKQLKSLDVRIGIGIGEKNYKANKVTQCNGSAFVHSGEAFESLKRKILSLKSDWPEFDVEINQYLDLASLVMNNWPATSAIIFKAALEHPGLNQAQLAEKLGKSQSSISESLSRTGFEEIMNMEKRYRELLQKQ